MSRQTSILCRVSLLSALFICPFATNQFWLAALVKLVPGINVGVACHDPGRNHRYEVPLVGEPPRVLLSLHVLPTFVGEVLETRAGTSKGHYVLDRRLGRFGIVHQAVELAVQN